MTKSWLIDKSAIIWLPTCTDVGLWLNRIDRGLVRICTPTLLEEGYSARSGADWDALMSGHFHLSLPLEYITPDAERRALEVQSFLARRGQHRAASVPDILIAAIAERSGLTVLHVDKDFDLIAEVTGQPVERLRLDSD